MKNIKFFIIVLLPFLMCCQTNKTKDEFVCLKIEDQSKIFISSQGKGQLMVSSYKNDIIEVGVNISWKNKNIGFVELFRRGELWYLRCSLSEALKIENDQWCLVDPNKKKNVISITKGEYQIVKCK